MGQISEDSWVIGPAAFDSNTNAHVMHVMLLCMAGLFIRKPQSVIMVIAALYIRIPRNLINFPDSNQGPVHYGFFQYRRGAGFLS
jgi:hypothetical protein